jgi:hypothetical protein
LPVYPLEDIRLKGRTKRLKSGFPISADHRFGQISEGSPLDFDFVTAVTRTPRLHEAQ